MKCIKNVSQQPIQFQKYRLLPKRKVMISEKELKFHQIQNLLKSGFLQLVEIQKAVKIPPEKSTKKKTEKKSDIE